MAYGMDSGLVYNILLSHLSVNSNYMINLGVYDLFSHLWSYAKFTAFECHYL